jgi:hypothetical protein
MFQVEDLSAAQTLVSMRTNCDIFPIEGSEKNTLLRIVMFSALKDCFTQYFSMEKFADRWNVLQSKIPQFAAKCEYYLYKSAPNMEVYKDTKTLRARIVEYQNRSTIVAAAY